MFPTIKIFFPCQKALPVSSRQKNFAVFSFWFASQISYGTQINIKVDKNSQDKSYRNMILYELKIAQGCPRLN